MATAKTIRLDGLDVRVEADGEEPLGWDFVRAYDGGKRPALPVFRYVVTITTDEAYRYAMVWRGSPEEFESGNRDYDAVAYSCLSRLASVAADPRVIIFGAERVGAAKRLQPLLDRNAAAIEAFINAHPTSL